jgi:hypothetical protein
MTMSRSSTVGSRPRRAAAALGTVALVSVLALSGCGVAGGDNNNSASANAGHGTAAQGEAAPPKTAPGTDGTAGSSGSVLSLPLPTTGRSLIYTGELQLRTPAVDSVVSRLTALVASTGGYIDSEVTGTADELSLYSPASSGSDSTTSPVQVLPVPSGIGGEAAQLVVRIPVASYDSDYQQLLGLGTVLDQERSTQDVTQQVVDVASRLKTEQASVDRVRALMGQATDIDAIIGLESALTQRESALESLEAQQQALQSETSMSTVTVQVYQQASPAAAPRAAKRSQGAGAAVWGALKDGWHGLYLAFRGLLVGLAAVLPFAVVVLPLGWLLLLLTRRYRRGGPEAPGGAPQPPAGGTP